MYVKLFGDAGVNKLDIVDLNAFNKYDPIGTVIVTTVLFSCKLKVLLPL